MTPTEKENPGISIYPNPVNGPTFHIQPPSYNGLVGVELQLFTAAFRKVQDKVFPSQSLGTALEMETKDKWGSVLANGLYYVVVLADGHRSVGKMIVLQ